jgi:PAS domain S-box-containing protein
MVDSAVQQRSADLEDFFENAPVALHLVARDGTIVRANRAELDMLGYSAEEYIGRHITEFHADRPIIDDILKRLLRNEAICQYPARLRAKDGSIRQVQITSNARVQDGEFITTRCMTVDVTEQINARNIFDESRRKQAALYGFIARLQRVTTLGEVYDAALDTIVGALGCERASILIFDQADKMRFVAWRRLSDDYRRAVDGHSPWTRESENPEPIAIEDVRKSDLSEALKQTVEAEGIGALAFIPLVVSGRLIGKFMSYYDRPHVFSAQDVEFAATIARQLAFGIERVRTTQAAQRLAAIVESSHDAIISKDLDGVIQTWNNGAERIFGYTAAEAIGKPVTILFPPDRFAEEPYILARIRSGEKVDHYETVRQRKDGSLVDISLTVSPVRDPAGRIVGASKISRDISSSKHAERRLRYSEKHLQDLLAAMPAAVYTTDAEGRVTYFNEAAVDFAGRTPVLGQDQWCVSWKLYWPDGSVLPHDQCPMAIALKEGRPVRGVEAVAERPDGTRVPFIPYPTPLRDAAGKVVGAINMLVDISERKQAETHQRMLLNELNHRVKNNMQMMQSLLDAAARQIRTPEAQKVFNEASRRIAAMAAAQRVLYGTTNATQFSCEEFLASVCTTAQETLPSNVRITCERASGELSNDSAMPLALILNELLTNAAKHGANGGSPTVIRAGLTQEDDSFLLYVEDDGPGFDLEAVRQQSSGLRLVQGLARQLGGHLDVARNPSRCNIRFFPGGLLAPKPIEP